jgi:arylformamidase
VHLLALALAVALQARPTEVTVHRDLVYGEDPVLQALDVYVPAGATRPLPYLVFIHGGGWSEGDKGIHTRRGNFFARHGFVYATINYRLSPAVRHPVHAQDAAHALAWLRTNAGRFGADPDRMYLLGHSAGAHLAALVAADPRKLALHGMSPSFIRGVILLDGSGYDVLERIPRSRGWSRGMFLRAFGDDPEVWKDASPQHHLSQGHPPPPFLLFHVLGRAASHRQARAFGERVREVGGRAEVVGVAGRNHVSISRRLGMPGDPVARRLLRFVQDLEGRPPALVPPPLETVPFEPEDPPEAGEDAEAAESAD